MCFVKNTTVHLKRIAVLHATPFIPYLLGLLAMIKCSICSYQCDNWYVSNWRLACHINFYLGRCPLELAQGPSRVALAWRKAGGCTPFGVTNSVVYLRIWNQGCVRLANCQHRGKFKNTATHSMKMPAGKNMYASLSTVLAQDHFYSDFLSLSLTILTHKGSMRMIIICCGVESALAFVTGGMNYSTVDYLNGSYLCNKLELICSSVP